MFLRHHTDKLIYPIIVLLLLVYISYRPTYRLRAEMPSGFFSAPETAKNDIQRRIARSYWQSALTDIQWKYSHGQLLPADPPQEFRADPKLLGPLAGDATERTLYWHRLRDVWELPDTWTEKYEWDWSWTNDPFTSASEWLHEHADLWMKAHAPR